MSVMKKNWILVWCGLFFGCQTGPHYEIEGKVEHFSGKVWLVTHRESGEPDTLEMSQVKNGEFRMEGTVGEPLYTWLKLENRNMSIPVFLENTSFKVVVDAETGSSEVTGGPLQEQRKQFALQERQIRLQRDSLKREYKKAAADNDLFAAMHVRALLLGLDSASIRMQREFIKEHDNLVAASLLKEQVADLIRKKELHAWFGLLGDSARQSSVGKELKYAVDHWQVGGVGRIAPDFILPTPEGKEISLYGVKAKVKILDFWASWCAPCRAENPRMRDIYSQYHDKGLEIIGVSLDSKKEPWLQAIEKDRLPWIHVSDLQGWENAAAKIYGVKSIPHILVLDENNRILGERLYGEELSACVEKALD